MRIVDAGTLESGDYLIELRHVRHRPDADPVQSSARDLIVANEDFAVAAQLCGNDDHRRQHGDINQQILDHGNQRRAA